MYAAIAQTTAAALTAAVAAVALIALGRLSARRPLREARTRTFLAERRADRLEAAVATRLRGMGTICDCCGGAGVLPTQEGAT